LGEDVWIFFQASNNIIQEDRIVLPLQHFKFITFEQSNQMLLRGNDEENASLPLENDVFDKDLDLLCWVDF